MIAQFAGQACFGSDLDDEGLLDEIKRLRVVLSELQEEYSVLLKQCYEAVDGCAPFPRYTEGTPAQAVSETGVSLLATRLRMKEEEVDRLEAALAKVQSGASSEISSAERTWQGVEKALRKKEVELFDAVRAQEDATRQVRLKAAEVDEAVVRKDEALLEASSLRQQLALKESEMEQVHEQLREHTDAVAVMGTSLAASQATVQEMKSKVDAAMLERDELRLQLDTQRQASAQLCASLQLQLGRVATLEGEVRKEHLRGFIQAWKWALRLDAASREKQRELDRVLMLEQDVKCALVAQQAATSRADAIQSANEADAELHQKQFVEKISTIEQALEKAQTEAKIAQAELVDMMWAPQKVASLQEALASQDETCIALGEQLQQERVARASECAIATMAREDSEEEVAVLAAEVKRLETALNEITGAQNEEHTKHVLQWNMLVKQVLDDMTVIEDAIAMTPRENKQYLTDMSQWDLLTQRMLVDMVAMENLMATERPNAVPKTSLFAVLTDDYTAMMQVTSQGIS